MSRLIGQGSTALVTGCSSGLGLELTRLLLRRGLRVWGISRRDPAIDQPGQFRWVGCDLADKTALLPALEKISGESGGVDLVVNNAGFGQVGRVDERSIEELESAMRVVLLAPILATRFFLADTRPPAVIVNTSSLASELPIPLMAAYNSAKSGLSGFTLSMALDRTAYPKTRFIDFRPGDYRTPFVDSFVADGGEPGRSAYVRRLHLHHERAPGPERAAVDLWRAIEKGKTGTVRSGTFFQAVAAPLGVRLMPASWLWAAIRRYYGIK